MSDLFEDDLTEEFETIMMTDDDGNEVEFAVINAVEKEGVRYLLVVESDMLDDEAEDVSAVVLKEVDGTNDELIYEEVIDDDEITELAELFSENGDEEYTLELED